MRAMLMCVRGRDHRSQSTVAVYASADEAMRAAEVWRCGALCDGHHLVAWAAEGNRREGADGGRR